MWLGLICILVLREGNFCRTGSQAGSQIETQSETETSMGGRPRIHAPGNQFELGYYRLNLSDKQLDDVSDKLRLILPEDRQFKDALKTDGMLQPADGQELVITYKGNYVRIKYEQGKPVRITPEDKPKDKSKRKSKR
jgi:hypothetical protein